MPGDKDGRSFDEVTLHAVLPGDYPRIEDVDFRNLTFRTFDEHGEPDEEYDLQNGKYDSRRDPDDHDPGGETVSLDSVHYLHSGDSTREYAIALYTWFGWSGSSSEEGVADIYRLFNHQLSLEQQIGWDQHFDTSKPYVSFNELSKLLVFRSAHYLSGDAHCCISAMDVVTMKWNGTHFVRMGVRTELSDYGIRDGKKL